MLRTYNGFDHDARMRAYRWAKEARLAGQHPVPRTRCDACGGWGGVRGHSEDYSEPYGRHIGFFSLCTCCHQMVHGRFSNPGRWDRYRAEIRHRRIWPFPAGGVLDLIHSGNLPAGARQLLWEVIRIPELEQLPLL